jgi:hypothetical protein
MQKHPSKEQLPKKVWWHVVGIVSFFHLVSLLSLAFYSPKPTTVSLAFITWLVGGNLFFS